ncbi:hypothetical protein H109_04336 [Trichophyton interdigitale MR816]|uniref:Uncharacterized protein n=1 Tax=Trichophyton interdigitale (strain MR816) TaxID=1215338 RepID=A0A059J7L0_TRIIM|nr:hypothetical protein H101_02591 [Trichophyton interdigitale H6]KDB23774.1 hypothetical protein H109_04336 [Trichophyton interdigitale MR816]
MLTRTVRPLTKTPEPDKRPTVRNMVKWLWHDGFYKGVVGWRSNVELGDISLPSDAFNSQKKRYNEPRHEDFDEVAACFKDESCPPNFVEEMIEKHSELIPRAVKKIDKQLLHAGVSGEEVDRLGKGHDARKKEAYAKLDRLVEAKRQIPPEGAIYRVVFGKVDGRWLSQEVPVDANCTLAEFDSKTREYSLASCEGSGVDAMVGNGIPRMNERRSESQWLYKLVPASQSVVEQTEEGWKRLETPQHFERLKKRQIQHRPMTVLMCREEMLHHLMLVADPVPETKLKTQPEPYRRILLGPESGETAAGDQEEIFRVEPETEAWAAEHGYEHVDRATIYALHPRLQN